MKLTAPTNLFFIISGILAILAISSFLGILSALLPPIVKANTFWIMVGAWGTLAFACLFKGV